MLQNDASPPLQPPDDHKISWLWFLLYVIFYVVVAGWYISEGYLGNIIFFPLVFLTTIVVYLVYKSYIKRNIININLIRFSDLFRGFGHSFFGGGLFALLTEIWISTIVILIILLLFGSSRALQAVMQENFDEAHDYTCNNILVHLYLFFTSFFVAGLIEEFIKGFLLQYIVKLYLPHTIHLRQTDINTFIWFGISIGLGFGTMEGIMYVCITGGGMGIASQFILWLIRAFIAIPFHSIMGFMWGTQLAQRDANKQVNKTWIKMGYQQVLLHGLYDFIEMEIALDLVCAKSKTYLQIIISISIAIVYTLFSALLARVQYKNLIKISNNQYQHQAINN